jgi:hypothetical protein
MDELMDVLFENLRLLPDDDLSENFLNEYESVLKAALDKKTAEWTGHYALGRSPSWFLAQCRPLQALLCEHSKSQGTGNPAKRRKLLHRHSSNESIEDKRWACIDNLKEADIVVIIAMNHIQRRKNATVNLATILYEIHMALHQKNHGTYMARYDEDVYSRSFQKLVDVKLVEYRARPNDLPPRYWPCHSVADRYVGKLCTDLDNALCMLGPRVNSFRELPSVVQVWASQGAKALQ